MADYLLDIDLIHREIGLEDRFEFARAQTSSAIPHTSMYKRNGTAAKSVDN
jgi:hypothetical protein